MAKAGEGKAFEWLNHHASYNSDFCLIFPFYRNPNGYGQFGHMGKMHWAHRFMCELVNGPAPSDKHEAAHTCGNGDGGCANPRHLTWKTKSQNRLDAIKHGTGIIQRNGNRGSLTQEQAMEIRELKGTMLQREIAEKFDISEPRVRAIFAGTIYKAERKIHNWTPEEDAALRDAVAHGLTANEIAAELGKSRGAITTRMGRLELRSESPRAHEQRRMAALRLAAKGQAA